MKKDTIVDDFLYLFFKTLKIIENVISIKLNINQLL